LNNGFIRESATCFSSITESFSGRQSFSPIGKCISNCRKSIEESEALSCTCFLSAEPHTTAILGARRGNESILAFACFHKFPFRHIVDVEFPVLVGVCRFSSEAAPLLSLETFRKTYNSIYPYK
jgi:hypothetical protein